MSNIRSVNDFPNYNKIFRGGKMEKKTGIAKEVKEEIKILKSRINVLFINRGVEIEDWYENRKLLILDIVELIMDCEKKAVKEAMAKKKKVTAEDIESEDFYNLMQIYRFVPLTNQKWLIEAYTDVKTYIANFINKLIEKQK